MSDKKKAKRKSRKKPDVKGDDRNLVAATESSTEAFFEERLLEYWHDHKGFVIFACIATIAVVGGMEVSKIFRAQEVEKMQQVYLGSGENQMTFADAYATEPLGGVAYLTEADKYYKDSDFGSAAETYLKAAQALGSGPAAGRARIGAGISYLKNEQQDKGIATLTSILDGTEHLEVFRVEAAYHLAVNALANGQQAEAREYLNSMDQFTYKDIWSEKMLVLQRLIDANEITEGGGLVPPESPAE